MNFPDALAASPIAAAKRYPILFTQPQGKSKGTVHLNADTAAWLSAHKPTKVWVLGGAAGAVPAGAAADVQALTASGAASSVTRLWGQTQYDTAIAINTDPTLTTTFNKTATGAITVAVGTNFPDALAGGVFAAKKGAPLFLIAGKATKPNVNVETAIVNWRVAVVSNVYVFGGTGVLTDKAVALHLK